MRWEQTWSGGKSIREPTEGKEKSQSEGTGWGLWLPLLTAIDFL